MDPVKHVGGVHHGRERQAARLHEVPAHEFHAFKRNAGIRFVRSFSLGRFHMHDYWFHSFIYLFYMIHV
jgi:hypothetical protein